MKPIGIEPLSPKKILAGVCLIYKNQEKQKKLLSLITVNRDLNNLKEMIFTPKANEHTCVAVMPSIPSIKLNKIYHTQIKPLKL